LVLNLDSNKIASPNSTTGRSNRIILLIISGKKCKAESKLMVGSGSINFAIPENNKIRDINNLGK
jgi:hypothetical protein